MKYLPDPFNFDKICSIAANIITERTKANDNSKVHVSFNHFDMFKEYQCILLHECSLVLNYFQKNHFKRLSCSDRFTEAFMPFVFGPHNCVGMRFALLEIKLTLVRLLKKHKLERTEKTAVSVLNYLIVNFGLFDVLYSELALMPFAKYVFKADRLHIILGRFQSFCHLYNCTKLHL